MTDVLKIYGFPLSGHSHRVELFANLAGLEHKYVLVDLAAGEHKKEPFLKLNPFGQVPAIEDGDVVLADSNAILVYLAKKYAPDWLPSDPLIEAEIQRLLSVAAGEIKYGPALARLATVFGAAVDVEKATDLSNLVFGRIEKHLEGRDWAVGEMPTIADVALYSYTAHAPEGNVDLAPYPNILNWLARIEALPGFVGMPVTKVGLVA
ncbi:glutathione S-transferase [Alphaproteobacteria bacterium 46_93_T64]|nr:glutathione S-transferase [Alphaproteobacteria bacterium 46_93_T64]